MKTQGAAAALVLFLYHDSLGEVGAQVSCHGLIFVRTPFISRQLKNMPI